jgi:H+/Cl- antiporter ClcA
MDIYSIRLFFKRYFDKSRNARLKKSLMQAVPFWIASVITGLVAVLYTKLFLQAENLAIFLFHWNSWILFALTPACFVCAWWLVSRFSPYARGSGIPQVTAAIEITDSHNEEKINKLLSIRIVIIKAVSSLIMAIGGGVIGREGPTIQIAASIYKFVNDALPQWWPKVARANIFITGGAAGLAAAFNTPLGGIVFAIEELTRTHFTTFRTAIFSSVIIAGLTVEAFLGPYLYLGYPKIGQLFLEVIIAAAICGLLGSAMSKIILVLISWRSRFRFNYQQVAFVVCCGLLMAAFARFADINILGSGKDLIDRTLFTSDKYSFWYTPLMRISGTIFSYTTGAGGGIFAPALGAGASVGSLIAGWYHLPDTDTNILILSGMVGFLTGVTRTPFTSVILVLEMTNHHNIIFHLILAGTVSSLTALLIDKHSLYEHLKIKFLKELNKTTIAGIAAANPINEEIPEVTLKN